MHSSRSLFLAFLATVAGGNAWAQDDIWTRKTLLDSPGGPKQELAAKGVDLGFDVTNFMQALQNGGSGYANGGKVDLRVQARRTEARHLGGLLRLQPHRIQLRQQRQPGRAPG